MSGDLDLPAMPCGYVRHQPTIDAVRAYCAGPPSDITGAAQRMIASGVHYMNLTSFVADFLKKDRATFVMSNRKLIDLGDEGVVIAPYLQVRGTCDGASHSDMATWSWIVNYVLTGSGPYPSECSLAWAYLAGRDLRYVGAGDSGAIPGLTVRTYHDIGPLPMSLAPDLRDLVPCGTGQSQESVCMQYCNDPSPFLAKYADAITTQGLGCRVFSPQDAWSVADCIASYRPVTYGCGYQAGQPQTGGNGISSIYNLAPNAHETAGVGFFTLNGRLGLIKRESWGAYPGQGWPNNRVTINTDDGQKILFPGESALWADSWLACGPEVWAIGNPGSN